MIALSSLRRLSCRASVSGPISRPLHLLLDGTRVVSEQVLPILDTRTACQKQITGAKVTAAVLKFQKHKVDTGSSAVQIAVLTEKIISLARHFAIHKKDHHSKRGFQKLISKRRQLMKHLRRSDFDGFATTIKALNLEKEAKQLPLNLR